MSAKSKRRSSVARSPCQETQPPSSTRLRPLKNVIHFRMSRFCKERKGMARIFISRREIDPPGICEPERIEQANVMTSVPGGDEIGEDLSDNTAKLEPVSAEASG